MALPEPNAYRLEQPAIDAMRPGANIRSDPRPEELAALAESLKVRQHHPVILLPDMTILDGWRRWLAARQAGIDRLWAVNAPAPLTPTELRLAQFAMGQHRADITAYEKFRACADLLAENPDWTRKLLARKLSLSEGAVSKIMAAENAVPAVLDAFRDGRIEAAKAYAIASLPPESQPELLAAALAGATRDELEQRARTRKRPAPTAVRVKRICCPLPSGVTVMLSGAELTLEEVIDALAEAGKAARKALQEGLDARLWATVQAKKAAAT